MPSAGYSRHFKFLKRLTIPLPPLEEQRRIAAILDKADQLRAKRKRALALLDTLTQSIFLEMFGDPVTNPHRFPEVKFGEVGRLDRGVSKHRPRNDPVLLGGPYPLIQTGDVSNSRGYITSFSSTYSDAGLRQSRMWPAGTLCITIAANIAQTGILTLPACFPDSVVGFTHESRGMVQYVRVWLSFLQATLERSAPTVAQKNINLQILRSLPMPCPPLELVEEYGEALDRQLAVRDHGRASLADVEALFTSLQSQAFTGQL
ncbi:restriction endonuclease subunit S [Acuticoccus sp. M5D2P5]|nr:restriction endonuclease subunit S [Acuticoccus kalidii]MCF3931845.1 restriction endonuclease subunit S [Acuticoccus kalidii]